MRDGDIRQCLTLLCNDLGYKLAITEVDILRQGNRMHLLDINCRTSWISRLDTFEIVIMIPPCASFSHITCNNTNDPAPMRDANCPLVLPGLVGAELLKAIRGNVFMQFMWDVLLVIHAALP